MNDQLPEGSVRIDNPVELCKKFDMDKNGVLDIDEFCLALKESSTLKGIAESLDTQQVENLQQHNEMLLMAFKYLDTDKSGAIDKEEFQRGVDLLNKRLPDRGQLRDPKELFNLLDQDGNGEIGTLDTVCGYRHERIECDDT